MIWVPVAALAILVIGLFIVVLEASAHDRRRR